MENEMDGFVSSDNEGCESTDEETQKQEIGDYVFWGIYLGVCMTIIILWIRDYLLEGLMLKMTNIFEIYNFIK